MNASVNSLEEPVAGGENRVGKRRRGRLQTRLTAISALLVLGAASVVTFLLHRLSVESLEHVRFLAASDVAESIALRLAAGVPTTPILDRVLQEYVHAQSEIVAASVLLAREERKTELLSAAGMSIGRSVEQEEALRGSAIVARIVEHGGERFWSVAAPIRSGERTVGAVGVWSTLQAVELMTEETRRLALIVLPGSLAALVLLLHLVFRREVQGPMEFLRQAMIRVEEGDLTAEAPVVRTDEIGFIATQYNKMLSRIRRTQEEREELLERVQGFNEELSTTVERATAELKARNEELQRLNQELFLLQRRLVSIERRSVAQQMTARLAHKIGTPLNLISGHVQILKRAREGDAELREKLELVQSQIEKLTDTVEDTLDETRASLRREPLDVNRILESIGALLRPTLSVRGVELDSKLAAGVAPVDGVEDQLEQVFLTIINNSLDAMPKGGHLTLATGNAPGGGVRVTVRDDGEGIPEAILPRIFRPFFTTKEPGRGTGLGLSIVQEILTAHRAAIRVESVEGQGTTFTVHFPPPEPR
jgi:signal transduction histidine kinase